MVAFSQSHMNSTYRPLNSEYRDAIKRWHSPYLPSKSSANLFGFDEAMDDSANDSGEVELVT